MRTFRAGDNLFVCDLCGGTYYASTARKQWDGLITCRKCWNQKHPQLEVKAVKDVQKSNIIRPRPTDRFIHDYYIAVDYWEPGYTQDL